MNTLPFHFSRETFMAHPGIARCSETARSLWLAILEEGYCSASLDWDTIRRVARRHQLDPAALVPAVYELLRHQVCDLKTSGAITPVGAEYLQRDFWTHLTPLPA